MRAATLSIHNVAVYALSREKDKKRIERNWDLDSQQLKSAPYSVFREFLKNNITILFNKGESEYLGSGRSERPPIHLEPVDVRKERSGSYVVQFKKKGSRKKKLDDVRAGMDRKGFRKLTKGIALLLKETPFWPKSYLIVVRFSVSHKSFRETFVGILTTRLEQGRLAESPKRIMEQLAQGVIGDVVKKGLIYPHLVEIGGDLLLESKAKAYEDTRVPASYFYAFLGLEEPISVSDNLNTQYDEYCKHSPKKGIGELADWLDDDLLAKIPLVNLEIDGIRIRVPLGEFDQRISIIALRGEEKAVLIRGRDVRASIGSHDAIEDGTVSVQSRRDFLDSIGEGRK
ncbi:MAG: hypothetical protein KAW09_03065 [Thermoplasmata archaeon]|nr:hypothetical protein [Thermoplasmata archaeon]